MDIYQELINKPNSPINSADIGQLNIFRVWYTNLYSTKGQPSNDDLVNKLTAEAWDEFCSQYLVNIQQQKEKALQAPQTPQTPVGGSAPMIASSTSPSLKVALKDYPITTGKSTDWPRFRRKFIATATANGHEEILSPTYQRPSRRNEPDKYATYLKLNHMTFSALDYGTADSIICHKVNKHHTNKDGRAAFLEIDAYQQGQGSDEVCASNAWAQLNRLKLTPVYPGGAEAFLAKWEDVLDKLRDVNQAPNQFLERTMLKDAIQDEDYSSVLTSLDLLDIPPSVEKCKAEIRKKGAKLDMSRKSTASRKARITYQADQWGPYKSD